VRLLPDLLRLLKRLAADPAMPRRIRVALVALVAFVASPIDLIPDVIPAIGFADDVILVGLVLRWITRAAGPKAPQLPPSRRGIRSPVARQGVSAGAGRQLARPVYDLTRPAAGSGPASKWCRGRIMRGRCSSPRAVGRLGGCDNSRVITSLELCGNLFGRFAID
jgi:Protein of unknown function (DUF1232)